LFQLRHSIGLSYSGFELKGVWGYSLAFFYANTLNSAP
jgi:hypothetical protein